MKRKGGFMIAKQTFEVPADTIGISFGIDLNFKGSIEIAELALTKKE
jgi:hypothetical protein